MNKTLVEVKVGEETMNIEVKECYVDMYNDMADEIDVSFDEMVVSMLQPLKNDIEMQVENGIHSNYQNQMRQD